MSNLAKVGVGRAEYPEARLFQPKRWRNCSNQNDAETSGFLRQPDLRDFNTNRLAWREA